MTSIMAKELKVANSFVCMTGNPTLLLVNYYSMDGMLPTLVE